MKKSQDFYKVKELFTILYPINTVILMFGSIYFETVGLKRIFISINKIFNFNERNIKAESDLN